MELKANTFTRALAHGDKQVGLWITLSSPFVAEVTAPAGYDWALIDMEHSPNDYMSVLGQLQAFANSATTAIVRPEWNDTVTVKRLLDLGVPGLLFPMIQTVEEAQKAIASTRYPPLGVRGVSGSTRANKFGRVTNYLARVEAELTVLLQLETAAAIGLAVEIGSLEGVSGIFFGPADIAADIGLLGQPMHPDVWALIRPAAAALIAKGIPVGTLVMDTKFAAELLNDGFTFVACASDASLLAKASDAALASVKGALA
ncbi:HpcH/HpaI aldolase family protein [Sulfitobacter guttiformis]|uniref:4-hydroxy-2-oxoheptanedioate aldolase n=1 Tax=Sulfitobacter guttiformis TaxID=74349 RepID=A0A420DTA8_9RHOB|nr:aldolase/citrate lyase family protein [Sulfitobacter guttiformis]KIN74920.1 2-dehydro-3-deoxyglucarate aldolase [Sulfitobacter guttiformis KCTC 32187]RKE97482.1 4-hydroxy-2-oxoheptanedioate aldolase [Sulfitobacter guttiformis]